MQRTRHARHPLAAQPPCRIGHRLHRRCGNDGAGHIGHCHPAPHHGFDRAAMVSGEARHRLRRAATPFRSLAQNHRPGLDAYRTTQRTQIARRAGIHPGILEIGFEARQPCRVFSGLAQSRPFARDRNALARCQRHMMAGTGRLAKAALDAQVHQLVGEWHDLEILDVDLGIVIEQHARIEQSFGVEDRLDPMHQRISLGAPFRFHEGRDRAASAMLGLERALIAHGDQLRELLVKSVELLRRAILRKIVAHLEVQIAGQRMPENDRVVIAMLVEQIAHIDHELGQPLDGRGHVLGQHRSALGPCRPARGEEPLANVPQRRAALRVAAQLDMGGTMALEQIFGLGHFGQQRRLVRCCHIDQHCRRVRRQPGQQRRHWWQMLHRRQGPALDIFGRGHAGRHLHAAIGHFDDGASRRLRIGEGDQARRLERMLGYRVVGHLGNKAERAFRPHHQMDQDFERVVIIDQRIERIAHRILDPVFVPDQRHQFRIRHHLVMQLMDLFEHGRMADAEGVAAGRIARIEHGAVGEHNPQTRHGVIGVLRHPAAHARGVIIDHPADLAGRLAGRVGADLLVEGFERPVGLRHDDRRSQGHLFGARVNVQLAPAIAQHRQHAVGHRLARQRGARRPEGHRQALGPCRLEHGAHIVLGIDEHHYGRDQPVGAGIAAPGVSHQWVGMNGALYLPFEAGGNAFPGRQAVRCRGMGL